MKLIWLLNLGSSIIFSKRVHRKLNWVSLKMNLWPMRFGTFLHEFILLSTGSIAVSATEQHMFPRARCRSNVLTWVCKLAPCFSPESQSSQLKNKICIAFPNQLTIIRYYRCDDRLTLNLNFGSLNFFLGVITALLECVLSLSYRYVGSVGTFSPHTCRDFVWQYELAFSWWRNLVIHLMRDEGH